MSDTEIRRWARDQGIDVTARGPVSDDVRARYDESQRPTAADVEPVDQLDQADAEPVDQLDTEPAGAVEEYDTGERTPRRPASSPRWLSRGKGSPAASEGKPARRRISIENVVSTGWGVMSMLISQHPRALPMARVLQIQAPVAGTVVEQIARGTLVDRVLQPLARAGANGEKMAGLFGPPLIVGLITANPALYEMLLPLLRLSLATWVEISGPAMKKARERAQKMAEEFGGVDIDAIIEQLFAPPPEAADVPAEP